MIHVRSRILADRVAKATKHSEAAHRAIREARLKLRGF